MKDKIILGMKKDQREELFRGAFELTRDQMKLDAVNAPNIGLFFENELESIENTLYDIEHEEKYYDQDMTVDTSDPEGAMSVGYKMKDSVGKAKLMNTNANDVPRADVYARKYVDQVHDFALGTSWSVFELMAASLGNISLDTEKIAAVREGHIEAIDEFAYFGDSDINATGLFNNGNVTITASVAGATTSATAITGKNPQEILRWIRYNMSIINTATKRKMSANTLLLPSDQYDFIAMTEIGMDNGSNDTILNWILKQEGIGITRISARPQLTNASASGATDRAVFYNSSPKALALKMPVFMKPMPIFQRGAIFELDIWTRMAPLQWRYPVSAMYVDGV